MAVRPGDRYATTKALASDLEHWLADEPILARREPLSERVRRWVRKHRGLVGLGAASVIIVLTVGVAALWVESAARREAQEQHLRQLAEDERTEADEQRKRVVEQEALVQRVLYFSNIALADRAWHDADIGRLDQLLAETQPQAGREDLRGFEYYYLRRLRHSDLLTLRGHNGSVTAVSWSPDGKRLATAADDKIVRIWDAENGGQILSFSVQPRIIHVAWSPDGKRLAGASGEGKLKVWDAASGQTVLSLGGQTDRIVYVCWSPNGKSLAGTSRDKTLKVWDMEVGRKVATIRVGREWNTTLSWSPDGKRLIGLYDDKTVKVWDAITGQEQEPVVLKGLAGRPSVFWGAEGRHLASTRGADSLVRIWDLSTGRESLILKGHTDWVLDLAWSPDGRRLASTSDDRTVRVWDAVSGQEVFRLKGHAWRVSHVSWSPDGKRLASASLDGTVKIWDAETVQEAVTFRHTERVHGVSWSPDGKRLASVADDPWVRVWDAAGGQNVLFLRRHSRDMTRDVSWSPDGQRLASGDGETVRVWDARTGREALTLGGHSQMVWSVTWSPDGRRLASASADQTVMIWDADTGRLLLPIKGHSQQVYVVSWSPDGRHLASGSGGGRGEPGEVRIWDATTGQQVHFLKGHTGGVYGACWSPDGRRLATSAAFPDKTVKIWDAESGREVLSLRGHTESVYRLSWSRDGKRLASTSGDNTVKVWDVVTGREALTLKDHTGRTMGVCWSPDGWRLASASEDGTVKVWDANPSGPASRGKREAQRLVVLDSPLLQALRGERVVQNPADLIDVARFGAHQKRMFLATAGLFKERFRSHPAWADAKVPLQPNGLRFTNRRYAADAAAMAAAGEGDGAQLTEHQRGIWRQQALDWLRLELQAWKQQIDGATPERRAEIWKLLADLQTDIWLASVRDAASLDRLPVAERGAWRRFWDDVAREALRVKPDYERHFHLGAALALEGKLEQAAAEYREALRIKPDYALAHHRLGIIFASRGRRDEAIAEYHKALDADPTCAYAEGGLGLVFLREGRFAEARDAFRHCLALLPERDAWRPTATAYLRRAERSLVLDPKLPAILKGTARPAGADEQIEYAQLCAYNKLYGASVRLFLEAFAADPELADDLAAGYRYDAASCAARAGSGQGDDADQFGDQDRSRWRKQALAWLQSDLVLRRQQLKQGKLEDRVDVQEKLRHWQNDVDLASLRDPDEVRKLPGDEQELCSKLWAEVEAILREARTTK
jgi:WD40 repeat protein/tetratricopeptide (TPR) repeat protein